MEFCEGVVDGLFCCGVSVDFGVYFVLECWIFGDYCLCFEYFLCCIVCCFVVFV